MPHRRRKRSIRLPLPGLALLLLAYFLVHGELPWNLVGWRSPDVTRGDQKTGQGTWRTVRRVVDGDTVVLENGNRVRLIGVDTPETKHPTKPVQYFGREASAFTKKMVEGKRVRIEFDQTNAHVGHRDRYGRTLAYVYLPDGRMLNSELVRLGYGHAYTRFPFKYLEEFRQLEKEAREKGRGLWAPR